MRAAITSEETPGLRRADVRVAALAGATLAVAYACWMLVRPFLIALAWAAVLALLTRPIHRWIRGHVRRPGLAAGLAVAVVTLVLVAPVVAIGAGVASQVRQGLDALSARDARARWDAMLEKSPRSAPFLRRLEDYVRRRVEARTEGAGGGGAAAQGASAGERGGVGRVVHGAMEALIALFALFFFFRDEDRVLRGVRDCVPLGRRAADRLLRRVADTIRATTYGTLVVAAVQGLLGGLIFWWLGLPAAVLWGLVMAFLALVPVLGAFVVWVPAAAFLAMEGSWGKALILTAWGLIVISLIDNLLYPVLVGKRLRMHTLVVFLAIVGGLSLFGAAGLFLGPAFVATGLELRRIWRGAARGRARAA